MKKEIEIRFSKQAEDLLNQMPNINQENVLKWFIDKGISIGGGNICDYLRDMKNKNPKRVGEKNGN